MGDPAHEGRPDPTRGAAPPARTLRCGTGCRRLGRAGGCGRRRAAPRRPRRQRPGPRASGTAVR
ncbi:hypothetical protein GZL_00587 [Streptomyces sp. 769]|nr:hypothetical protein GZL_00587 [Streptomyces sp. 769]